MVTLKLHLLGKLLFLHISFISFPLTTHYEQIVFKKVFLHFLFN